MTAPPAPPPTEPILLQTSITPHITHLTLNRPHILNALNIPLYNALTTALISLSSNPSQKVIILSGTGTTFTSGMDLTQIVSPSLAKATISAARNFMTALMDCRCIVAAAVQGSATGIGVTLLLHCDLVYADGRCVFKTPFASIGIVPEFGASYMGVRMLRKVTWTRLFVLGEDVAARDMGEVCEVVDGGRDVVEYVKRVCGKWVDGMGEIEWKATENAKRVIRASVREGCEKAMEREERLLETAVVSGAVEKAVRGRMEGLRRGRM